MAKTVPMIGLEVTEIRWIRMLTALLRHPDPSIPELARQALVYLTDAAARKVISDLHPDEKNQAG